MLLVGKPGKVFSRDEILNSLRGIDCEAYNRSVDITMSRLRQKLGDDPKTPRFIKTVWGAGYVFIGQMD
jgi:DNA-binding response OmpR family regulator